MAAVGFAKKICIDSLKSNNFMRMCIQRKGGGAVVIRNATNEHERKRKEGMRATLTFQPQQFRFRGEEHRPGRKTERT